MDDVNRGINGSFDFWDNFSCESWIWEKMWGKKSLGNWYNIGPWSADETHDSSGDNNDFPVVENNGNLFFHTPVAAIDDWLGHTLWKLILPWAVCRFDVADPQKVILSLIKWIPPTKQPSPFADTDSPFVHPPATRSLASQSVNVSAAIPPLSTGFLWGLPIKTI